MEVEAVGLPVDLRSLIRSQELWEVTETTRLRIQVAEVSFLRRVAGLGFRQRAVRAAGPGEVSQQEEASDPRTAGEATSRPG